VGGRLVHIEAKGHAARAGGVDCPVDGGDVTLEGGVEPQGYDAIRDSGGAVRAEARVALGRSRGIAIPGHDKASADVGLLRGADGFPSLASDFR
jgi:hypothetical protein